MISVQSVSKNFGPIKAVTDISFEIKAGEVVGFLGPNGAGKSTTLRMICGYFLPSAGKITISNHDVSKDAIAAKACIGYLPESAALYTEMTAVDFLLFMGRMRGMNPALTKERLKVVSRQCQLQTVLTRKIVELSKGYRQRVGLAQALLHDPQILVLDEPTVGLDPNQISEIRSLIKEIGQTKTILLSTHILSEVSATCQRVLIISQGHIVAQGAPQSLGVEATVGTSIYQVQIKGATKDLPTSFAKIKGFSRVDVKSRDNGDFQVEAVFNDGRDVSEDIFDLAVSEQWKLLGLSRKQGSLEDVFKNLTQ